MLLRIYEYHKALTGFYSSARVGNMVSVVQETGAKVDVNVLASQWLSFINSNTDD
jgi:hypothetical protein